MIDGILPRWLGVVLRLYRVSLKAYPAGFRARYGAEMERVLRQRLSDALAHGGGRRVVQVLLHTTLDLVRTSVAERVAAGPGRVTALSAAAFCLSTTAAAIWLMLMERVLRHPAFERRMAIAAAIAVLSTVSVPVVLGFVNRSAARLFVSTAAMMLLALGGNAMRAALSAPHFEGFALIISAALMGQALLTLWVIARSSLATPGS